MVWINYEVVVFLPSSGNPTALDSVTILMFLITESHPACSCMPSGLSVFFWVYPDAPTPTLSSAPAPAPPHPTPGHPFTWTSPSSLYLSTACTFTPLILLPCPCPDVFANPYTMPLPACSLVYPTLSPVFTTVVFTYLPIVACLGPLGLSRPNPEPCVPNRLPVDRLHFPSSALAPYSLPLFDVRHDLCPGGFFFILSVSTTWKSSALIPDPALLVPAQIPPPPPLVVLSGIKST